MNAVGIDVSKGKSMVAALQPGGKLLARPFEVLHTKSGIRAFPLSAVWMEIHASSWSTQVVTTSRCSNGLLTPIFSYLPSIPNLSKTLEITRCAASRRIKPMPRRLRVMPLTTGTICLSIQAWIPHAQSSKPSIGSLPSV